jgi:hypothetical protein
VRAAAAGANDMSATFIFNISDGDQCKFIAKVLIICVGVIKKSLPTHSKLKTRQSWHGSMYLDETFDMMIIYREVVHVKVFDFEKFQNLPIFQGFKVRVF